MAHYRIRPDKKEELLQGRTITYVAKKAGINRVIASYALNGYNKRKLTYKQVEKIMDALMWDSIKINAIVTDMSFDGAIEYFFEKID